MQRNIVNVIAGIVLMRVFLSHVAEQNQNAVAFGVAGICVVIAVRMLRVGIELMRPGFGADKL